MDDRSELLISCWGIESFGKVDDDKIALKLDLVLNSFIGVYFPRIALHHLLVSHLGGLEFVERTGSEEDCNLGKEFGMANRFPLGTSTAWCGGRCIEDIRARMDNKWIPSVCSLPFLSCSPTRLVAVWVDENRDLSHPTAVWLPKCGQNNLLLGSAVCPATTSSNELLWGGSWRARPRPITGPGSLLSYTEV